MLQPVSHQRNFHTSGEAIKLKMMYINLTLHFRLKRAPWGDTARWNYSHNIKKLLHATHQKPLLHSWHFMLNDFNSLILSTLGKGNFLSLGVQ